MYCEVVRLNDFSIASRILISCFVTCNTDQRCDRLPCITLHCTTPGVKEESSVLVDHET